MKRFLRFWIEVFRNFGQHRCVLVAAALSYYMLLSVVPITMVVIAILGYVLGNDDTALTRTLDYFGQLVPDPKARGVIDETVRQVIEGRRVVTKIGVLALLWTGSQLFMTLQAALNVVWNVETPRNWVVKRLISIAGTLSIGFLALLSIGANAVSTALQKTGASLLERVSPNLRLPWLWQLGTALTAIALLFVTFLFVYRLLPSMRVRWREAALAALITTALWLSAKEAFAWYITDVATTHYFYGSLGGVIVVLIWGFYSALVMLFAAETAANYGRIYIRHTKSLSAPTTPDPEPEPELTEEPCDTS